MNELLMTLLPSDCVTSFSMFTLSSIWVNIWLTCLACFSICSWRTELSLSCWVMTADFILLSELSRFLRRLFVLVLLLLEGVISCRSCLFELLDVRIYSGLTLWATSYLEEAAWSSFDVYTGFCSLYAAPFRYLDKAAFFLDDCVPASGVTLRFSE